MFDGKSMLYGVSGVAIGTSVINYSNMLSRYIYIKEVNNSMQANKIISSYSIMSCVQDCNNLVF